MPYSPQTEYRADRYLAAGISGFGDKMGAALDHYTDASKKATALRKTLKLYAPSIGPDGEAVAASVDAMSLPELEGAVAGLAQYAAQTQANERQKLAADEEKRRAAHDEALRAYYEEGRKLQKQQQDRLDQAAQAAADWQAQMGDYADAYGTDPDSIRAAIAYANRVAPGGMPREVAADLLSGTAAKPQWTPQVMDIDGTRVLMTSPNSAQPLTPTGTGSDAIKRTQANVLLSRVESLNRKLMTVRDVKERQAIEAEIARLEEKAMAVIGLSETPTNAAPVNPKDPLGLGLFQ